MKIALVTGASGAIGRNVSLTLAQHNWQVIGVGHGNLRREEQLACGLSQWFVGDVNLATLQAIKLSPKLIVHCAGSGSVGASYADPHSDFVRSVSTTMAVLEYIRINCPNAKLVYPSSAAVYGAAEQFPISVTANLNPASPYGIHKKIAEDLILEYSKYFKLKCAIVRLFSIYGEGFRKQLLWDACKRISSNEALFYGTGDETRDWLHVTDASELLLCAGEHADYNCPIFNGAAGKAVTVREIISELIELMRSTVEPVFCGSHKQGDPVHYLADVQRTLELNWMPQISLRDGLIRYVNWFNKDQKSSEET